jgi:ElaB/YqjD/DUF883 family membrane-anchored ribosome-binding protein
MTPANETRTPDEIRRDIEHTREELAETAAALAERADVKARAHEKIDETKARITGKVDGAKAKVADTGAQGAVDSAGAKVRANPIPTALVAGFAAGALIGWLVAARR